MQHLQLAANSSSATGRQEAGTLTRPFFVGCGCAASRRPRPALAAPPPSPALSSCPPWLGCPAPVAAVHKPHAPYYAPKEFFERLPPPAAVPLPLDPFAPVGMPEVHPPP